MVTGNRSLSHFCCKVGMASFKSPDRDAEAEVAKLQQRFRSVLRQAEWRKVLRQRLWWQTLWSKPRLLQNRIARHRSLKSTCQTATNVPQRMASARSSTRTPRRRLSGSSVSSVPSPGGLNGANV
jgi:hypothetical protein